MWPRGRGKGFVLTWVYVDLCMTVPVVPFLALEDT